MTLVLAIEQEVDMTLYNGNNPLPLLFPPQILNIPDILSYATMGSSQYQGGGFNVRGGGAMQTVRLTPKLGVQFAHLGSCPKIPNKDPNHNPSSVRQQE